MTPIDRLFLAVIVSAQVLLVFSSALLVDRSDLKEIGVASLGHRKKLLEAIAILDAAPEVLSSPVAATPGPGAERRHLTVMFVDLVGSTALSEGLAAVKF